MEKKTTDRTVEEVVHQGMVELWQIFCRGIIDCIAIFITFAVAMAAACVAIIGMGVACVVLYNIMAAGLGSTAVNNLLWIMGGFIVVIWAVRRTIAYYKREKAAGKI